MKTTTIFAALALIACSVACSKQEAPAAADPPPAAPGEGEAPIVFDPKMPSFKCGGIRCNVDYYCVERKHGTPTEVCTSHPPGRKREGCTKVATRSYTCETFP
jgi:hypothetical protein